MKTTQPIRLSYSVQRAKSIHIQRTEHRFTATEAARMGYRRIALMMLSGIAVIVMIAGQWLRYRRDDFAIDPLAGFGVLCLFLVASYFALGLVRRRGNYAECLEITAEFVRVVRSIDVSEGVYPTSALHGVVCERKKQNTMYWMRQPRNVYRLRLLRIDGTSEILFEGHSEQAIEEVEFECRMFLASIRPSPMANTKIPPRPRI